MELFTIIARRGRVSLRLTFGSRAEAELFRKAHPEHCKGYILRERSFFPPLTHDEAAHFLAVWIHRVEQAKAA